MTTCGGRRGRGTWSVRGCRDTLTAGVGRGKGDGFLWREQIEGTRDISFCLRFQTHGEDRGIE